MHACIIIINRLPTDRRPTDRSTARCVNCHNAQAIAGLDAGGMDPRQPADKAGGAVPTYSELATGDVGGLRIGVLAEGLEG